jgi:hypothetical protein
VGEKEGYRFIMPKEERCAKGGRTIVESEKTTCRHKIMKINPKQ